MQIHLQTLYQDQTNLCAGCRVPGFDNQPLRLICIDLTEVQQYQPDAIHQNKLLFHQLLNNLLERLVFQFLHPAMHLHTR